MCVCVYLTFSILIKANPSLHPRMNELRLPSMGMFSSLHHDIQPPLSVCSVRQLLLCSETVRERKSALKCGLLCNPSQGPFAIFVPGSARHGWVFSLVTSLHQ